MKTRMVFWFDCLFDPEIYVDLLTLETRPTPRGAE